MPALQAAPIVNVVGDPLSIVLVALGGVFIAFAVVVLGYLALGAGLELLTPTRPARTHGR